MDTNFNLMRRLVHIAFIFVMFFMVFTKFYSEHDGSQMYLSLYLLAAVILGLIVPQLENIKTILEKIGFVSACLLIAYMYLLCNDSNSILVFYFFVIKISLFFPSTQVKKCLLFLLAEFVVLNIYVYTLDIYNLLWLVLHSSVLIVVSFLCLHGAETMRIENRNIGLAEQKLKQMQEMYNEMYCLAQRDGLTGLYNYRTLKEYIDNMELINSAIILLDVDFFKTFNDNYGHLCGDAVLREIAKLIKENVRGDDIVFRYGGEEFAIMLKHITDEELKLVANRIVNNICNYKFVYNGQTVGPITVSVGYALASSNIESSEKLLYAADMALYKAKASGRNTVCCYKEITAC